MPSHKPKRRFQDILENISLILDDVEDVDEATFGRDRLLQDAVLFRLLRISEAAVKLGPEAERLAPDQPWQPIRAFGNVLRHEYDLVAINQVWLIVTRDLPSLARACRLALADMDDIPPQ